MKRKTSILLFCVLILGVLLCLISYVPVSVQSKSKTNVKLEIVSANKKKIKFKLTNSGKKDCHISFYPWKLQRKVNGKWKTLKLKENAKIPKSLFWVKAGKGSFVYSFYVKKYYPKKLQKGNYQLTIRKYKAKFEIK